MEKRTRRFIGCALAACALGVAAPVGASASEGDFLYDGGLISSEEAVEQALICSDGTDDVVCYDSVEEAEAADQPTNGLASTDGSGGIGPGTQAACGVRNLYEYRWVNYGGGGPYLGAGAVGVKWYNYNSTYVATTTSFQTGDYRANFAGHKFGGGQRYGMQPVCAYVPNLKGSGWNNRFRSRKRFFG